MFKLDHLHTSAARVSGSIDYDINPCENFYDFACGMWMKRHVVPEDRSNLYTYGVLRDDVAITIKCKYQHTCISCSNLGLHLNFYTDAVLTNIERVRFLN